MKPKIRDFQVKKNIKWYILRLLRRSAMNKETLINKIVDIYLGYWRMNNKLIESGLSELKANGLIKIDDLRYKITERGLEVLNSKEKALEEYDAKHFSKEGCARDSLWANVGLSALEFVIGFISGSIGLIADAVHTAVDILASAVTWIGIRIDKETQAAFWGGIILCGIGFFIGFGSLRNVFRGVEISFQLVALVTITINIAVNGYFSFYKFKRGLGRRFPVMLEENAYERIYSILEREGLVETVGDKLKLTQRGEDELKSQAISPSLPSYIHRSRFWFARRIRQYAEGL
jgi:DNA-binding PadR family transcriptional regulator